MSASLAENVENLCRGSGWINRGYYMGRAGIRILSFLDISTVNITVKRVASQRALIHKHSSYVFPKYGIHR